MPQVANLRYGGQSRCVPQVENLRYAIYAVRLRRKAATAMPPRQASSARPEGSGTAATAPTAPAGGL
jgi:hypothetical protein